MSRSKVQNSKRQRPEGRSRLVSADIVISCPCLFATYPPPTLNFAKFFPAYMFGPKKFWRISRKYVRACTTGRRRWGPRDLVPPPHSRKKNKSGFLPMQNLRV